MCDPLTRNNRSRGSFRLRVVSMANINGKISVVNRYAIVGKVLTITSLGIFRFNGILEGAASKNE